jgi:membrane protein required for colicin V production
MAIDIIFVIVAGYGFYLGFSKGIIQTVFTVLSIMFGLMAAIRFAKPMTDFLEDIFSPNALMFIAGFLLTFVLTMFLIRLIAKTIEGFLKTANINIINQLAGGMLLAAIFIMLYSVILWFGDQTGALKEAKETSMTYDYLEEYPQYVWGIGKKAQPYIKDFYEDSQTFMDRLGQMGENATQDDQ